MIIDVKNVPKEKLEEIKKQLDNLGVKYIEKNDYNVFEYKEKIKYEHQKIIESTNKLNEKGLNLVLKAALDGNAYGLSEDFGFYFNQEIKLKKTHMGIEQELGENFLVITELFASEEVEELLNYLGNEFEFNFDLDLTKEEMNFFASQQGKIKQIV